MDRGEGRWGRGEGEREREPMDHNIKGKKKVSAHQNHMNNAATQNRLSHDLPLLSPVPFAFIRQIPVYNTYHGCTTEHLLVTRAQTGLSPEGGVRCSHPSSIQVLWLSPSPSVPTSDHQGSWLPDQIQNLLHHTSYPELTIRACLTLVCRAQW